MIGGRPVCRVIKPVLGLQPFCEALQSYGSISRKNEPPLTVENRAEMGGNHSGRSGCLILKGTLYFAVHER